MRAVVVQAPRHLAVEKVADPTPEAGQVVLRVSACGICGSDLHLHQAGLLPPGAIMGHEFCGEVVERAGELRSGDRVCALPTLSCGRCARCQSGLGAYCTTQRPLGFGRALVGRAVGPHLAACQIAEADARTQIGVAAEGAAHADLEVVGMGPEGEQVHGHTAS